MRMLLIDNYDSFTYNLVQAFAALGAEVIVHRNDAITVDEARARRRIALFASTSRYSLAGMESATMPAPA